MTFIYVPPYSGRAAWPPVGRPVGSYPSRPQARRAIEFLVERKIPRTDLTVISLTTWPAGIVAMVAGVAVGVPVGLIEGAHGWVEVAIVVVWAMATVAVLLGAVFAVTGYLHNRRVRRFVRSASLTASGRHVVVCTAGNAERARDLLATPEGSDIHLG